MMDDEMEQPPSLPKLDGPDEYHVFVDMVDGKQDSDIRAKIRSIIKSQEQDLTCMNTYEISCSFNLKAYIANGYLTCQKVVVVVTKNYLDSENIHLGYQLNQIAMKSRARGPFSVIFVLIGDEDDKKSLMNRLQPHGLSLYVYDTKTSRYKLKSHELQCLFVEKVDDLDDTKAKWLKYQLCKELIETERDLPRGEGTTLAWSYYYGYINVVAPGYSDRVEKCYRYQTIKPRRICMAKRIFVLCPESGYSPPKLSALHEDFLDCKDNIPVHFHRAGKKERNYTHTIYKIKDKRTGDDYYAALEVCGTLVTFYETYAGTNISEDQAAHTVHEFYCSLSAILRLRLKADEDVFVLVYYKDKSERTICGDMLLDKIKVYIEKDKNTEGDTCVYPALPPQQFRKKIVSSCTSSQGCALLGRYDMSKTIRGKAIIINNIEFVNQGTRKGADFDSEKLRRLLNTLGYDIEEFRNQSGTQMRELAETYSKPQKWDHKDYNGFIMCISTHGEKGYVSGVDGDKVPVLSDLVAPFYAKSCPTLANKPRMFFIQACQNDELSFIDVPAESDDDGAPSETYCQQLKEEFNRQVRMQCELSPDSCCVQLSDEAKKYLVDIPGKRDLAEGIGDLKLNPKIPRIAHDGLTEQGCGDTITTLSELLKASSGLLESDARPDKPQEQTPDVAPREKDILISYSCLPGQKSMRHPETGSLYITALEREIDQYGDQLDLDRLLKLVSRRVNYVVTIYRAWVAAERKMGYTSVMDSGPQFPFHIFPSEKQLFIKN